MLTVSHPIIRFVYTLPPWIVVGGVLLIVFLLGAGLMALILGLLAKEWKDRQLRKAADGEIETLRLAVNFLESDKVRLEVENRAQRVAIRGAQAALNLKGNT